MISEWKIFENRFLRIGLVVLVLFPAQFPFQEIKLIYLADAVRNDIELYEKIQSLTDPDDVIFSDVSDAVWWYSNRNSVWIPVVYNDFKTIAQQEKAEYVFIKDSSSYFDMLTDDELLDMMSITEFVDGDPLSWGFYKIDLNAIELQ